MIEQFLEYLTHIKKYSVHTINGYKRDILDFEGFVTQEGFAESVLDIKRSRIIRHYISYLQTHHKSSKTISRRLSSLRMFYEYCVEEGVIDYNFMHEVQAPKVEKRLPKRIHDDEIETLFKVMDKKKPIHFIESAF